MDTVSGHAELKPSLVRAGSVEELRQRGFVTVSSGHHGIVVFWHEGAPYAVDNRCPHMGFPLSRGTIRDGVLTCHWHHARFDLQSGGTFDPFADDVPAYGVEVRDGEIWVETTADARNLKSRWLARLQDGQEQNLSLVTAKSILALRGLNVPASEILLTASLHGARFRREGLGTRSNNHDGFGQHVERPLAPSTNLLPSTTVSFRSPAIRPDNSLVST